MPPEAISIVEGMLRLSPDLRPTSDELLNTEWLRIDRPVPKWTTVRSLYKNMLANISDCQVKKFIRRLIAEGISPDSSSVLRIADLSHHLDRDRDGVINLDDFC